MFKKSFVLFVVILAGVCFILEPPACAQQKFKVVIVMLSKRTKYMDGKDGMLAGLKKKGFDETRVEFEIKNAEDSEDKLKEIIKELKEKKPDLIMAISTKVTSVVSKEIKDIPIVLGLVSDPISAGLVKSMENSGNNVTGACTWVETAPVINVLRQLAPMKRLGYLCTSQEEQTNTQTAQFKKSESDLGYTTVISHVNTTEGAVDAARVLVGRVDAVFIGSGSIIAKNLEAITEVFIKFKIPTIVHADDKVEGGILLAVSVNSFQAGELSGEVAAEVLGGKQPSQVPLRFPKIYDIIVNLKTANKMGTTIPVSLLKIASKVIKNE